VGGDRRAGRHVRGDGGPGAQARAGHGNQRRLRDEQGNRDTDPQRRAGRPALSHPAATAGAYHPSMAELEIGLGKTGRRAYGFDDIAIVPSRRTRDPEDVDISWELEGLRFELPLLASAMDGVVSPATAIEIGRLGGAGVLN